MPRGAVVLSAHCQYQDLCVWALVNPALEDQPVGIRIIGTGNPVDDLVGTGHLVGTVIMPNGLVWHVFSEGEW